MIDKKIIEMIEPEALKDAMRTWLTGVAIVTGKFENAVHGMTANSFNSIALDPPTVLVALRRHTRTQHLVKEGGVFAISILDTHQVRLAKRFAGQVDNDQPRFDGVETFELFTGAPMIEGAIAFLDCKVIESFNVGDTTVFLGEVLASQIDTEHDHEPLLYFNRQWRKLDKFHD
jgi:flavin reductase (DIM6/NTAB) family NADH-FMN oxidoreductase RutF